VRRLMREGAGKGKFAVLINMVTMDTPVENVHAAVEAVKQFGRYPIPDDLERQPFRKPSFAPFEQWVKEHGLPVDNV
jgi:hypothetical protein